MGQKEFVVAEPLEAGEEIVSPKCFGCGVYLIIKKVDEGEKKEFTCPECQAKHRVQMFKNGKAHLRKL